MKTIKNATEIVRKKDDEAAVMVEKHGWKYCPKSLYKAAHGKKVETKASPKAEKVTPTEEPKVKKGKGGSAAAEAKYREKKSQRN